MPTLPASKARARLLLYLIDTNVISEARKAKAHPGVSRFFQQAQASGNALFLSAITIGELRRGVELIRYRGDQAQAKLLETWLTQTINEYGSAILSFDDDAAQIWGRLRVPRPEHELDKQIAAIALLHDLTVVTRNTADFAGTGVRVTNPIIG